MSEKAEKKKRYNAKLQFVAAFEKWLLEEPKKLHFIKWRRWKDRKPTMEMFLKGNTSL